MDATEFRNGGHRVVDLLVNPVNFRTRPEHIQGLFHDLKEI
jgi:hypothetical protein